MEPALHQLLLNGQAVQIPEITLDRVRIEEVWPAVHDPVPLSMRERFLREVLEINDVKSLMAYGS